MPQQLPAGPFTQITRPGGGTIPLYLVPFDKSGICVGPLTRADLVTKLRDGNFTDILLFSHGWNNDFQYAIERYQEFISGYMQMRTALGLEYGREIRPIFVGVIWPSTALVSESEQPPDIASADGPAREEVVGGLEIVAELGEALTDAGKRARFYELAQKPSLNQAESLEFSELLLPLFNAPDEELHGKRPSTPQQVLDVLRAGAAELSGPGLSGDFGFAQGAGQPAAGGGPQPAGIFGDLDVRDVLRLATVWQMKDRAGTVGSSGVGPLLDDMLAAGKGRVHLIGHSYGCKVVLSALCRTAKSRPVNSVLLLQPAVSALCFAANVPDANRPGGFRPALDGRVQQPLLTTFSSHDFPLTKVFHLALRRNSDLGEAKIAGAPPSVYAALGGFGPQQLGAESNEVVVKKPKDAYDLGPGAPRVYGVNGSSAIGGHSEIINEATWWALYCQLNGPG